ncbi:MAG: hypothetical protein DMF69_22555 [Acidobacteria bacterium]|nr:MAG: hypothetical protein DMF69_22555 [Acidobacteriota bacterium]
MWFHPGESLDCSGCRTLETLAPNF